MYSYLRFPQFVIIIVLKLNNNMTLVENFYAQEFFLAIVVLFSGLQKGLAQEAKLITAFMSRAPLIDGHIYPDEWFIADSQTVFIQMEPQKGQAASEKTIVYTGFDNDNLYFAFRCSDKQSEKIVSNIYTRDKLEKSDDVVIVILDTYLDQRSGYVFIVNPAGTQTDIRVVDDGRTTDINWDTRWQAAARVYEWGWAVEIAIAFSAINYDEDLTEFGVNFGRIIRKNSETAYWAGAINSDYRISQGGILQGLTLPAKQKTVVLTPYTTLRYENLNSNKKKVV